MYTICIWYVYVCTWYMYIHLYTLAYILGQLRLISRHWGRTRRICTQWMCWIQRKLCVERSFLLASLAMCRFGCWLFPDSWKLLEQTSTNPHLKTFQNLPVCRCRFHQLNSSKPVVNHVRDASISKTPYLTKFKRAKDLLRYQDTLAGVFLVVW